jgi:hypothetical protein
MGNTFFPLLWQEAGAAGEAAAKAVAEGPSFWKAESGWFLVAVVGSLVLSAAILAAIHFLPNQAKRYLTVAVAFLAGLFYFLEFFVPPNKEEEAVLLGLNLTQISNVIGDAAQVVAGFTFLLGVYNLVHIHGNNVRRMRQGWYNSIGFFVAFVAMTAFAFWKHWQGWFAAPEDKTEWAPAWINDTTPEHAALPHDAYTFVFEGLYRSMDATMFSILAFYIVSAAYRAFRIRSKESAVLMVVALILMMGQVPIGQALTNWIPADSFFHGLRIEEISQFVLKQINSPVQRAIGFGLGLGALAMALRIWLSLERGSYFGEEA